MERTKEEIEKEILRFLDENATKKGDPSLPGCGLDHGTPCALGTSKDNIPRVTPVDFHHDGLTLWMVGDPGEKLANIRSNPNVSVGICTRMDHSKENRSIMLKGKASVVTNREQKELYMDVITELGILEAWKRGVQAGFVKKRSYFTSTTDEDFKTTLDKLVNTMSMIKVEPEIITLLIVHPQPDAILERLIWKKEW